MKTVSGNRSFLLGLLSLKPEGIEVSLEKLRSPEFQTMLQLGLVTVEGSVKLNGTQLNLTPKGLLYTLLANFDHHGEICLTYTERNRPESKDLVTRGIATEISRSPAFGMVNLKLTEQWMMLKLIIERSPQKYNRAQLFYEICQGYGLSSPLPSLKSLVEKGFVRTFLDNGELYIELI